MASLDSVAAAAKAADQARTALKAEVRTALKAGIPRAAIARAVGVSRNTLLAWEREE